MTIRVSDSVGYVVGSGGSIVGSSSKTKNLERRVSIRSRRVSADEETINGVMGVAGILCRGF